MGAHARFAPSSAHRIIWCPASLLLNEAEPDRQTVFAAEGTAAHFIGYLCLTHKCSTERYAGCNVVVKKDGETYFKTELTLLDDSDFVFEVDDEMCIAVQEYVDWCAELKGHHEIEVRANISKWCPVPDQFGTSDHVCMADRVLTITDLKYGRGVKVYSKENWQAIMYALGTIYEWDVIYDFEKIIIRIAQPRLGHFDVWEITKAELLAMGEYAASRFRMALEPNPPFGPTEKACEFCKVAGKCKPLAETMHAVRALAFEDLTEQFVIPNPNFLTVEELSEAWHYKPLYDIRMAAVVAEIEKTVLKDQVPVPGCKVVEAVTHRRWINDARAAVVLEIDYDLPHEKLFKEKMLSPAQVEKLLPKKTREQLAPLIYKPRGGPTVADEKDRRPLYEVAVAETHTEAFGELDDDGL